MSFRMAPDSPDLYHRILGPAIFRPYSNLVASQMPSIGVQSVLDMGCGTGIFGQEILAASKHLGGLFSLDSNLQMLEYAKSSQKIQWDNVHLRWVLGDMCSLPMVSQTVDEAVCAFGLMFLKNPVGATREARRVLRPTGCFRTITWAPIARNEWAAQVHEAVQSILRSEDLPFLTRPFQMGEADQQAAVLTGGGFVNVDVQEVTLPLTVASPEEFALGLLCGNPLWAAMQKRGFTDPMPFIEVLQERLSRHYGLSVDTSMSALIATGLA